MIIPVYNSAGTIHQMLRSALSQTLTDFEVMVGDDCSIDITMDILRNHELLDK